MSAHQILSIDNVDFDLACWLVDLLTEKYPRSWGKCMSLSSVDGMYRRYTPTTCFCTFIRMFYAVRVKVTFCSFLALLKMNCSLIKDQHSCSRSVEWSELRCCLDCYLHMKVIEQSLIISSFHKGFFSVAFFYFVLLALEAKTCWTTTALL